jgi:hypothetical protein
MYPAFVWPWKECAAQNGFVCYEMADLGVDFVLSVSR